MPTNEELWEEILRLRDRIHDMASRLAGFRLEIDEARRWRDEASNWRRDVNHKLNELTKSDEIAEAIAEKLDKRRGLELTVLQKLGAGIVACGVLAASVKSLFF